jgi:hypothetical protein
MKAVEMAYYGRMRNILFETKGDSMPSWLLGLVRDYSARMGRQYEDHWTDIFKEIMERSDKPFSIFVVGEADYGKSTLLTALCGDKNAKDVKQIANPGIFDYTWRTDLWVFSGSHSKRAVIHGIDGSERSDEMTWNEAKKQIEKWKDQASREDCNIRVEWHLPHPHSLGPVVLADTPGLNQALEDGKRTPWWDWIERNYAAVDAVLWLVDAKVPHLRSTKALIHRMSRYGKPITIVVNKCDCVDPEEMDGLLRQLRKDVAHCSSHVIPISALNAMEGTIRGDDQLIEKSGLRVLMGSIQENIVKRRHTLRNMGSYLHVKRARDEQDKNLDAKMTTDIRAKVATNEYSRKLDRVINAIDNKLRRSVDSWGERFSRRVKDKIDECDWKSSDAKVRAVFDLGAVELEVQAIVRDIMSGFNRECVDIYETVKHELMDVIVDYNGEVIKTIHLVPPVFEQRVTTRVKVKPRIPDLGWWFELMRFISNIPGGIWVIEKCMKGKVREWNQKIKCHLNEDLRMVLSETGMWKDDLSKDATEQVQSWGENVRGFIREKFGTVEQMENRISRSREAISQTKVNNSFAYVTTKALSKALRGGLS